MTAPFRWRRLTPDQEEAVAAARAAGASRPQLARQYGVTSRTIGRVLGRAGRETHVVELAGHRATFEIENGTPVQVTPWVPS